MSELKLKFINKIDDLGGLAGEKTVPPGDSPRHLDDIIIKKTLSAPTHRKIENSEMVKSLSLTESNCDVFCAELVQKFEKTVLIDKLGFGVSPKRQKQLFVLWKKARVVMAGVNVPVSHWSNQEALIWGSATKLAMHPNYFRKVLGLINEYGFFYAMMTGTSFNKVRPPKGFAKERMMNQLEKAGRDLSRACQPLSPLILGERGSKLPIREKNFLECCLWFGLRPSELSAIVQDRNMMRVIRGAAEKKAGIQVAAEKKAGIQVAAEKKAGLVGRGSAVSNDLVVASDASVSKIDFKGPSSPAIASFLTDPTHAHPQNAAPHGPERSQSSSNDRIYLDIYQNKLGQLNRDSRWKRIPVTEPEQFRCLELIQAGKVKKPSNWNMLKAFGKGFGLYSPRKGFAVLMLSRGWKLEAVSKMLGHGSIETTKTYYIGHEELLAEWVREAEMGRIAR